MPDLERLAALARGLLPASVAVAAADPSSDRATDPDTPAGAVPKRQREFAAGRSAARAAMASLGLPPAAIPVGSDRAPVWPAGLTGSITHSGTACLAAVVPTAQLRAIGLDLELEDRVTPDLWPEVLLPEELGWLSARAPGQRNALATVIFSAKEAAYKAQYPISRTLFGFDALQIRLDPAGRFTAEFRQTEGPFAKGDLLHGASLRAEGHVLCTVTVPLPAS
jgi:4'-phosphopantetheinyl transferase EntD